MFDEVMWTWVSYFSVFLGISRYFQVFPTALGNTLISRFIDNPGAWVQDESLIVHILTPQHSSSLNHA